LSVRGPIPIIGTTASIDFEDEKSIFKKHCNICLDKPLDLQELFAVIENLLGIHWLIDNNTKDSHIDEEELILPDLQFIFALKESAEIGDFTSIDYALGSLPNEHCEFKMFQQLIRKHIDQYDSEGLTVKLEDFIKIINEK